MGRLDLPIVFDVEIGPSEMRRLHASPSQPPAAAHWRPGERCDDGEHAGPAQLIDLLRDDGKYDRRDNRHCEVTVTRKPSEAH